MSRLRVPSNPVAITVIITSSPRRSLKVVPKMMFASGSAAARISSAASVTSKRLRVDEPVMLNRIPWAPVMFTSRSGLAIAWRAASTARFSPVARPIPISAEPASFMIARTAATSRLTSPGSDRAVATRPEAARDLVADPDLVRGVRLQERLRVRVAGDELDAHHLGPDHPVDGVAPAAADADDADEREVLGIGPQRHRLSSG